MTILLKGFGSIGKRHAANLLTLGYDHVVVVSSKTSLGEGFDQLNSYRTLEEALQHHRFSHGFICSPTSHHVDDLRAFLDAGISHIYLEKPVSHTMTDLDLIRNLVRSKAARVQVGFDLHFDPGLTKAKEILDSGVLGKIYAANAFVGQYLPDWRPHEDYRKGMSASQEQGGGVMLDLVHEFDYLRWLFGNPEKIGAFYQKNEALEIETEDVADVLIRFEKKVQATIHLDYHQRKLIRFCIFTGELGTLKWDLAERTLRLTAPDKTDQVFDFSQHERNDRYLAIAKAFMQEPEHLGLTGLEEGIQSLKMVLGAKQSSEGGKMIDFKDL
jgi:predicted dehydrogenase